ncbi:MAG: hypothetical protein U9R43_13965 [Thermodesulfobacteriota bacterium]|nr:hypothetical protein [Thermodesulfobacteriota bacterium]
MARRISQSVGDWQKGAKNLRRDVVVVQELLTRASKVSARFNPGTIDGRIARTPGASHTVRAILAFQTGFLKRPDGLVEPGKATFQRLNEYAPSTADDTKELKLLFNGKQLLLRTHDGVPRQQYPAVSGLKPNNPFLKRLIKEGRDDIKEGVDYSHPKHQTVSRAGPIPEGTYFLRLRPGMPFQKSGGGWGVGGWSIYPDNFIRRNLGFLEVRHDIDIPGIRGGFFLHHDGGADGTAGCIGLVRGEHMRDLKARLSAYQKIGFETIEIEVQYTRPQ